MIAERLKQLRKNKGISQRELAEVLGVRKTAVSLYETDKNDPHDPIKVIMAKYFDISLDYLLGVIDTPVRFYDDNNFLELPKDITEDEKELLRKFVDFIIFMREP